MTREQWLENMESDSPKYSELIELKDADLLTYLIRNLASEKMNIFVENVLHDDGTDFILSGEELDRALASEHGELIEKVINEYKKGVV